MEQSDGLDNTGLLAKCHDFVNTLSEEIIEAGIDEAVLDIIIKEELADEISDINDQDSDNSSSDDEDQDSNKCLTRLRSLRTMQLICIILLSIFVTYSLLQPVENDTLEKPPEVIKFQYPTLRPFFPNDTAMYVADHYTGEMQPERYLRRYQMVIAYLYAPWSSHSQAGRQPFTVVARLLWHHRYEIKFTAINCWAPDSDCKKSAKILSFPMIVAVIAGANVQYLGELSAYHLYKWVENLRSSVQHLTSEDQLSDLKSRHQYLPMAYFPFKNMQQINSGYDSFLDAGFSLQDGKPESDYTKFLIVTNVEIAQLLGFRYEGEIIMHTSITAGVEAPPKRYSIAKLKTAENIVSFVQRTKDAYLGVSWIDQYGYNWHGLSSDQLEFSLREGAVIILILPYQVLYPSPLLHTFKQIYQEYQDCDYQTDSVVRTDIEGYKQDSSACRHFDVGLEPEDICCRAVYHSIDWNMACASSAKYHWEGKGNEAEDDDSNNKKRGHWVEQIIPKHDDCTVVSDKVNANDFLTRCCEKMGNIQEPIDTPLRNHRLRQKMMAVEKNLLDQCYKARLADYAKYNHAFDESDEENQYSVECLSQQGNSSLEFFVMDSYQNDFLIRKLGIKDYHFPTAIIINKKTDVFDIMPNNSAMTHDTLRSFILEFHAGTLGKISKTEEDIGTIFSFNEQVDDGLMNLEERKKSEIRVKKLSRKSLWDLLNGKNFSVAQNSLIMFSGGSWQSYSANIMNSLHLAIDYHRNLNELDVYWVDTSRNDVHYQYQFETLPAFLILKAKKIARSAYFDEEDHPLSFPHLVEFAAENSHLSTKFERYFRDNLYETIAPTIRRMERYYTTERKEIRRWILQRRSRYHPWIRKIIKRKIRLFTYTRKAVKLFRIWEKSDDSEHREHLTRFFTNLVPNKGGFWIRHV